MKQILPDAMAKKLWRWQSAYGRAAIEEALDHAPPLPAKSTGRRPGLRTNDLAVWAAIEYRRRRSAHPRSAFSHLHRDMELVFKNGRISEKRLRASYDSAVARCAADDSANAEARSMLEALLSAAEPRQCILPIRFMPVPKSADYWAQLIDKQKINSAADGHLAFFGLASPAGGRRPPFAVGVILK